MENRGTSSQHEWLADALYNAMRVRSHSRQNADHFDMFMKELILDDVLASFSAAVG